MGSQLRRDEFTAWMKKQIKPNGESYSPATIETYVYALKTVAAKLNLTDITPSDLFHYPSPDQFLPVYHKITYDGQPGSRPPFSDPVNCEKSIAAAQAPLPHERDGAYSLGDLAAEYGEGTKVDESGYLCVLSS